MLLVTYSAHSQITYNKKIDILGKRNSSYSLLNYNDTLYIPANVVENLPPFPNYSASLLKISVNGDIILPQKKFKPSYASVGQLSCIYKSPSDKFYLSSSISRNVDVQSTLSVFNKDGDTLFMKPFGDTMYYSYATAIVNKRNEQNKLLFFGLTDSTCGSNHPGFYRPFIKTLDTLGNTINTKLFLSNNVYRGSLGGLDTCNNKGYIFSGFEQTSPWGWGTNYVIKLDSNLNVVWQNTYDSSNYLFPSITTLKDGGYILTSSSVDSIYQNTFLWSRLQLIKLSNSGGVVWNKTYSGLMQNGGITRAKELLDGDIVACGLMQDTINGSGLPAYLMGFIMRTDNMGNLKWFQTYKASNNGDFNAQNYLYDIALMNDGGFVSVGCVGTTDTSNQLTWLLRVDSMGCFTPNCQGVGIIETIHIGDDNELSIYPNPTSNNFIIEIYNSEFLKHNLTIYNDLGQVVYNQPVSYKNKIDGSQLANGVYLIKVDGEKKTITKRLIIQK